MSFSTYLNTLIGSIVIRFPCIFNSINLTVSDSAKDVQNILKVKIVRKPTKLHWSSKINTSTKHVYWKYYN